MAWYKKPTLPMALAVIIAFLTIFTYFVPGTPVAPVYSELSAWGRIIFAIVTWAGLVNVLRRSTRDIRTKRPGRWYFALYEVFLIIVILGSGFLEGKWQFGVVVKWMFDNLITPASLAITSALGFFVVRAAYRSFKLRTIESGLFLLGGIFIMLLNAPVGGAIWSGFPIIGLWIFTYAYRGVMNGLYIGIGLGLAAYGIRYMMGYEKASLGVLEEEE